MNGKPEVTICGNVVADPEMRNTKSGASFATFRVAVTPRRYVREHDAWADGTTSYYAVAGFGSLGTNILNCVGKGDPVVVHGTQEINEWATDDGKNGRDVQVTAEMVGHNLKFGRAEFTKVARPVLDCALNQELSPADGYPQQGSDQPTSPVGAPASALADSVRPG